jgi:hypothetical protein
MKELKGLAGWIARSALMMVLGCSAVGCAANTADDAEDSDATQEELALFQVNGHTPSATERRWLRYVATEVVPDLAGSRGVRIRTAARVSFWALKEGIFDLDVPNRYSNCNTSAGDRPIGALETCSSGRAWQVGLAAVQVPNQSLASVEQVARKLYPGVPLNTVLRDAAAAAGYPRSGNVADAIASSGGSLRESWLLRRAPIGFTVVEDDIVSECIRGSYSWCYGRGWSTSARYSPDKAGAVQTIRDLARIFDTLAPKDGRKLASLHEAAEDEALP